MYENLQKISLGIIKNSNNEVLIINRANENLSKENVSLSWAFPGGKIEKNESIEEAVVREILEETGYKVKPKTIISERNHPDFPVYIYYIECILETNYPVPVPDEKEVIQIKWVEKNNLLKYFNTNIDTSVLNYLNIQS